jgi:hypothetical protein
MKYLLSPGT